ncbi:MAG TPA: PspA/IM30 family protein [Glaciibacter sp.]|nr:PspA/IM30 family protein [Glaciibacter sp.]
MSNASRIRNIFRIKTSRGLDKLEDPREALDDSYEQQVKMLQQVRQGLAEVATARKRIELQGQEMGTRYNRLAVQAQEAMNHGREDLARAALERRSLLENQVAALRDQFTALQQQTAGLQDKERRLAERVAAFRIEKETIKATYTASQAQVKANEAMAGIGSQMNDVGVSLERARDRVAQMQARAAATDELLSSGALRDLTAAPDADLERQLSTVAMNADVERQLESMKNARVLESAGTSNSPGEGPDAWLSIGQDPKPTP